MAIRIIEEKPDPSVIKTVVCRNCGVKLEYVPADVKSRSSTDYSGDPSGTEWIDCPKCSKQVILKSW